MTDPETPRRVEIKHDDQTVAAAEVAASAHGGRIARASLHSAPGHIAPGSRASLVDAVLNLPEVPASAWRPLFPSAAGNRCSACANHRRGKTRPAGSTALVEATIPPDRDPGPDRGTPSP